MPDAADRAANDEARAWELFQQQRLVQYAADLARAAQRSTIDCVDCGEEIPAARIAAWPRSARCTPCASEVERR